MRQYITVESKKLICRGIHSRGNDQEVRQSELKKKLIGVLPLRLGITASREPMSLMRMHLLQIIQHGP